jgi:hypothetical protein
VKQNIFVGRAGQEFSDLPVGQNGRLARPGRDAIAVLSATPGVPCGDRMSRRTPLWYFSKIASGRSMSGAVEVCVRRPHRARHTTFMGPASANLHMNGLTRRSKKQSYSMTSSAATSRANDTASPSAFAVLRLMIIRYLIGI